MDGYQAPSHQSKTASRRRNGEIGCVKRHLNVVASQSSTRSVVTVHGPWSGFWKLDKDHAAETQPPTAPPTSDPYVSHASLPNPSASLTSLGYRCALPQPLIHSRSQHR